MGDRIFVNGFFPARLVEILRTNRRFIVRYAAGERCDKTGASALDPGFRGVHSAGYDGQFYWGIAVDPLALGSVHRYFDKPSYRYGHPLYGWLGWLVSGGQATAAPRFASSPMSPRFGARAFLLRNTIPPRNRRR